MTTTKIEFNSMLKEIQRGKRRKALECMYPNQIKNMRPLMLHRPHRVGLTRCIYISGAPGTGKTKTVNDVLKYLISKGIINDYYVKANGIKQYWEDYDNEDVVVIDDPSFDADPNDGVQALKNVISNSKTFVEYKFGSVTFDSKLVIIITNFPLDEFCEMCGPQNQDAMKRRLTDTIPPICFSHIRSRKWKYGLVMASILSGLDISYDVNDIEQYISEINYPVKNIDLSVMK